MNNPVLNRILLMSLLSLMVACSESNETAQSSDQLVDVAQIVRGDLIQPMQFSGVSQAAERASLAFQSSGVVRLRPVRIGDQVKQGDLLAALENPDLEPGRQAAQASLARLQTEQAQARRNVDRLQDLFSEGAVGEQSLEEEQTRLASLNDQIRQARAQLISSEDRLADSQLTAPFDALVGNVNFEVGEYVRAGEQVMILGGLQAMEVILELPTAIWRDLQAGQTVPVGILGLNEYSTGEIYDLGALADPNTGLFPVVVRFPSTEKARSGQRVSVEFEQVMQDVLQVPLTAIVDPIGGAPKVYRLVNDTAQAVPVEVLGFAGQQVAVVAGSGASLSAADQVISAGHMSLVDGQRVNVHEVSALELTQQSDS